MIDDQALAQINKRLNNLLSLILSEKFKILSVKTLKRMVADEIRFIKMLIAGARRY